jgi:hypothetical protein
MEMILKQLSFSRLVDADFSFEQETVCRESTDVILKVSIILVNKNRRSLLGRSEANHSSSGQIIYSATETAERGRGSHRRESEQIFLFFQSLSNIFIFLSELLLRSVKREARTEGWAGD